jgi:hypothetical protein
MVAYPNQVVPKHLVYETLLGLALHMNQQSGHLDYAGTGRPPISFFSQSWPML